MIKIDDSLSIMVFHYFIKQMDPASEIFSKSDIEKLEDVRLQLDDAIQKGDCTPYDMISKAYENKLAAIIEHIHGCTLAELGAYEKYQFVIPHKIRAKH